MGAAIRLPFRKADEPDTDTPEQDPDERIAKIIREHDLNQLFVAFTATPAPDTVTLFGAPFDTYAEAEAIQEGYIVDVATSIKAAVEYQGVTTSTGPVTWKPGKGKSGGGPPVKKVSVQDMIDEIRRKFRITDEEALYIKEVTEEKVADPIIRTTVIAHRASGLVLAHNHPAGPLSPSEADLEATRRLKAAGELLGIAVLDHLIFNRTEHFSFLENGIAF
jgi:hypothetical protein